MEQKVRLLKGPSEVTINAVIAEESQQGFKVQSIVIDNVPSGLGTVEGVVIILFEKR